MEAQVDHVLVVDPRETCAPLVLLSSQMLIISNHCSGFREEHPLVRDYFSVHLWELTPLTSSAIIQDVIALRNAGLGSVAYFYFDFRGIDKQNLDNLISSLLTQLSARSGNCCEILSRIYKAHDNGANKPSTSTMVACLKEMLALPGQGPIYIVLDALDECPNTFGIPPPRRQVLDLLKDLVALRLPYLHICVTSRPEIDIRAALERLSFYPVSLHDQGGQQKDIEDYIKSVVYADSDTAMRRWRDKDKELVIEALTERADGM